MLSKIICFVSSFVEFVLQMENRLYDNSYTHKKIRVGCIYCDADPVGVGVSTNVYM